jgi:beta-glucosidase/6-phospho-beta-glucosidase/beta-galactosidase
MRIALAILLAAFLAAPAHAASPLELAVQDDAVLLWRSYSDAGSALDRSREMGAKRIRVNLPWAQSMVDGQASASTRPDAIEWDFSVLERLYEDAFDRGLLLQVTLTGPAPAWATGDGTVSNVRPDPVAFGEFARAAATQFAGRVDRWSVWNEPNWHRRLLPASSAPSRYRSMYKQAYTAIKAADPGADVLIGELMPGASRKNSTKALRFLRSMTCTKSNWKAAKKCGPLVADGFALHPYNFARRPKDAKASDSDIVEIGSLSRLTRALDRLASRGALVQRLRARRP